MTPKQQKQRILVRGAGELASAVIIKLVTEGFRLLVTEQAVPVCVRRKVCLAEAVYDQRKTVEVVTAILIDSVNDLPGFDYLNQVPLLVDPDCASAKSFAPQILIDARMKKRNVDSSVSFAPIIIGLGPGFVVGENCQTVVETNRGDDLGRVIYEGSAEAYTAEPGLVGGETVARLLRSPIEGEFLGQVEIGEIVQAGQVLGRVGSVEIRAQIDGRLRGLIRTGTQLRVGQKLGDIDPRGEAVAADQLSDKGLAVAEGVGRAIEGLIEQN